MTDKKGKATGRATHYTYTRKHAGEMRQVKRLFNLDGISLERRRDIIHQLHTNGEILAILPPQFEVNCDLTKLERFLEGDLDD